MISLKVQRTITIDPDVNEALRKNPAINVSALCNLLLKRHLKENNMK